ncbi:hypothetical protein BDN70DRAFT_691404 [Pholiota conissans]|uniref:Uncharacterized protein n=1 Tax=Pholiota conissans TaxID=109636 RepID=A0A9P6CKY2_9AGAR|nr:hypothetical protein BDN70DRAFT_691404 [Pholiota conissans]
MPTPILIHSTSKSRMLTLRFWKDDINWGRLVVETVVWCWGEGERCSTELSVSWKTAALSSHRPWQNCQPSRTSSFRPRPRIKVSTLSLLCGPRYNEKKRGWSSARCAPCVCGDSRSGG